MFFEKRSGRLFVYTLAFLTLIIAMDQITGALFRSYYFKQSSGFQYRTTYSIDSTTAEIIILGSSRASRHYVPQIFENAFQTNFYNTGRDGNFLLYNFAIFKSIVARYTPKMIIFDINPGDIYYSQENYDRLSSLLPYYKAHPEIRNTIELRGEFEKIKLVSAIYPFNSMLLSIIVGNLDYNKYRKPDLKGYIPLYDTMKVKELERFPCQNDPLDIKSYQALREIAQICHQKGIRLVLVESPIYANVDNCISNSIYKSIANLYDYEFYSFINDTAFTNHPSCFKNTSHLNHQGAILFSTYLSDSLKKRETTLIIKQPITN